LRELKDARLALEARMAYSPIPWPVCSRIIPLRDGDLSWGALAKVALSVSADLTAGHTPGAHIAAG
jgi:hypothetical protein